MKKLNIIFLSSLLLITFSASAQTFPLLNNVYSTNCSDMAEESSYWQKNSDGEVVKYGPRLKENSFTYSKQIVKNYSIDGNKVSSELIDTLNQNQTIETFELRADGKAIRLFNFSSGGKEIIKDGKLVSDETRRTASKSLCDPNSQIAIFVKSQLQPSAIKTEAPVPKKLPSEGSQLSNSAGSKWKKIEKDPTDYPNWQEFFVDPASIKKDGEIVSLVWLINEDRLRGTSVHPYQSTVVEGAINCTTKKARKYSEKYYKNIDGINYVVGFNVDDLPNVKNLTESEKWNSIDEKINNTKLDRYPAEKRLFIEVCSAKSNSPEATSRSQKSSSSESGPKDKNSKDGQVNYKNKPTANTGKLKCYLLVNQTSKDIKSCDANVIKSSLTGFDTVGIMRIKSPTEIEIKTIASLQGLPGNTGEPTVETTVIRYTSSGNLITFEPFPNCFITKEVEEGGQYRKEYFKKASPGCPQTIIQANELSTRNLRSGASKGSLIIYE